MKTPDGKEITNKLLCERFPRLFADRYANMRTTAMCWGFEVGPGWLGIIYDLAMQLEPLITEFITTHSDTRNPFPTWTYRSWGGLKWSFLHPWRIVNTIYLWIQGEIWPETVEPWWPRACQVKEKFGTLRFYMTSQTDEMSAFIDKTERQSSMTCEICGKQGKLRGYGWYYTACARHTRKEDRK